MNTDPQPAETVRPRQAISDHALQMILESAEDAADAEVLISAMTLGEASEPKPPPPPKNWADVLIEAIHAAAWIGAAWMLFQYYTLN